MQEHEQLNALSPVTCLTYGDSAAGLWTLDQLFVS